MYSAESRDGRSTVVISIQDTLLATREGQRDFAALSKKFEPKRNELKSLRDEIDTLLKKLDTQSSKMDDEVRARMLRQIEVKQKTLARSQEDAQNDFVKQQNEIAQRILKKLEPIIDKYARDNGLGIIMDTSKPWPSSPVFWAGPSVDITKSILSVYDGFSGPQ